MSRKISVEIVGDAASLERSFRHAARASGVFGHSLTGLATRVTGLIGGFVALRDVIDAGVQELTSHQRAQAQTAAALKSTGGVAGVTARHVEELGMTLSNLSGINDEVVQSAENVLLGFTNVRNVAGKTNDIFDQTTRTIADMSARLGIDMPVAAKIVGKALQNPIRGMGGLARIGVVFDDVQRKNIKTLIEHHRLLDAQKVILAELTTRYKGAAAAAGQTFAGQLNILKERTDDLLGTMTGLVAKALLPYIRRATTWIQSTKNQQRVVEVFKAALNRAGEAIHGVEAAIRKMAGPAEAAFRILGGWKGVLAAIVAIKLGSWASTAAGAFAGLGANARRARGQIGGIGSALAALPTVITLSLILDTQIALHADDIQRAVEGLANWLHGKFSFLGPFNPFRTYNLTGRPAGLSGPVGIAGAKSTSPKMPAGLQGPKTLSPAVASPGAAPPNLGVLPPKDKTGGGGTPKWLKAFEDHLARLQLNVDRAGLTGSLKDDVKAQRAIVAYVKSQLRLHKGNLDIQQALVSAQSSLLDLKKQELAADKELRQKAADARQARQFRALGLTATGEEPIPGVRALRRHLGTLGTALEGTFLDTKKTRSVISRIRTVLAGGLGAVGRDVRAAIQQILSDLDQQLKDHAGDQTRFRHVATGNILAGLGLNPAQLRSARTRLAQIGPGGSIPQRGLAFAAAGATGGAVFTGPIHVHGIQNLREFEAELDRRARRRPQKRRGT